MSGLGGISWPRARRGEALSVLGQESGLTTVGVYADAVPDGVSLSDWMELSAARLGLEAESVDVPYRELEGFVRNAGPALLVLPGGEALALLRARGGRAQVIMPDLRRRWVPLSMVRDALAAPEESEARPVIARILRDAGVSEARRAGALSAILQEALGSTPCRGGWLIRLPPGASLRDQARGAGLDRLLYALVGSHAVHHLLFVGAWAMIGRGALAGDLDAGWLVAWALALATQIPLGMATTWFQGRFAIGASALLKRRMLQGALRLSPEETRSEGVGGFIARVNEAEAVESLALGGGLSGLLALFELGLAGWVLSMGAGGALHVGLLLGGLGLTVAMAAFYAGGYRGWTDERMEMTLSLVERMVGHRTRLAQEPPERWHRQEDRDLSGYLERSREMDRWAVGLSLIAPGWLVAGIVGLAPAFSSGVDATGVAVALGGVLLAQSALSALTGGVIQLVGAWVAWERVRPLYEAAARPERVGDPSVVLGSSRADEVDRGPIVSARGLDFRYEGRSKPVLEACALRIEDGDRLLLEGPSGGGKSTLASLLVGLREPDQGLLLLRGLDRATLGELGWRRRVVAAPQFHENHVLTGSFAFNVLMGRVWPAEEADLAEVDAICRELGLGELLERMPAGLLQMVGETGWQLSHGERSRLFIARALAQRADLVILDESFASLDPVNLARALACVRRRANALVVVAHP